MIPPEIRFFCDGPSTYGLPGERAMDVYDDDQSRCFKLKYLRQLMRAFGDLNFTHGIARHDVAPRNLLADAATNDVLLYYDFSVAGKMGAQMRGFGRQRFRGELAGRNDAKGLVLTLHEIITRDPSYQPPRPLQLLQLLDEAGLVGSPDKHADQAADQAAEGLEGDGEAVAGVDWGRRLSASSRRSPDLDTAAIGPEGIKPANVEPANVQPANVEPENVEPENKEPVKPSTSRPSNSPLLIKKRKKAPDTDTKLLEDEAPNSPGLTAKRTRRRGC
ncbi:hypothetical protein B0T26DRAFT_768717 [Lasiosphaeria miniovina]|uniref:Protein kinase domain-containing protein n=1 Tax=Lasiosphaeria miniovina TaxID=1954250 RepID=A0AA40E8C0_9PEZI|nr:uncharacterized protein B0T26DRAFT_768717 [Lasiosphaeria miniovina]KAK0728812.1 hypothetical protein B0T26DRAFT_768717 [Lasiosphaeria miniovina]